jgi:hypothetical protein
MLIFIVFIEFGFMYNGTLFDQEEMKGLIDGTSIGTNTLNYRTINDLFCTLDIYSACDIREVNRIFFPFPCSHISGDFNPDAHELLIIQNHEYNRLRFKSDSNSIDSFENNSFSSQILNLVKVQTENS